MPPGPQVLVIALRAVLREEVVSDADQQQRRARYHHGDAPSEYFADTEHEHAGEDQRHHHLGYAAAQVAPPGGGGVGRAHHVGGEHYRGVVLGDHEGCANYADRQPEQQEGFVAVGKADAHHRDGSHRQ